MSPIDQYLVCFLSATVRYDAEGPLHQQEETHVRGHRVERVYRPGEREDGAQTKEHGKCRLQRAPAAGHESSVSCLSDGGDGEGGADELPDTRGRGWVGPQHQPGDQDPDVPGHHR